jgi:hypothetical protein
MTEDELRNIDTLYEPFKPFSDALFELIKAELLHTAQPLVETSIVSTGFGAASDHVPPEEGQLRLPLTKGPRNLGLIINSPAPAKASVTTGLYLFVPKDAGEYDNLVVGTDGPGEVFEARVDEMVPTARTTTQMRARMFSERIIGRLVTELTENAQDRLRQHGY